MWVWVWASVGAPQKSEALDPWSWSYRHPPLWATWYGCWELNLVLCKNNLLLSIEPSSSTSISIIFYLFALSYVWVLVSLFSNTEPIVLCMLGKHSTSLHLQLILNFFWGGGGGIKPIALNGISLSFVSCWRGFEKTRVFQTNYSP